MDESDCYEMIHDTLLSSELVAGTVFAAAGVDVYMTDGSVWHVTVAQIDDPSIQGE